MANISGSFARVTATIRAPNWPGMNQPPDLSPPAPRKQLFAEERHARHAERLTTIRLRMAIGRELEDRDITTPAAIGEALGMSAAEAASLLIQRQ
jgi:hypothetical protein